LRRASAQPIDFAYSLGWVAAGFAVAAALPLTSGLVRQEVVLLSLGLPAILAQDAFRNARLTEGRVFVAASCDGVLLLMQTLLTVFTTLLMSAGSGQGIAPLVSYVLAVWCSYAIFAPRHLWLHGRSVREHISRSRRLWPGLLSEYVVTSGVRSAVPLVIAAASGASAVGTYRAGESVAGLLNVAFMGLNSLLAAGFVRRNHSRAASQRLLRQWTFFAAGASVLTAIVIGLTWTFVWEPLLGAPGRGALPVTCVIVAGICINQRVSASMMLLRAAGRVGWSAVVRGVSGPVLLSAVFAGSLLQESVGAAVGLLVGYLVAMTVADFAVRQAWRA
jgi:hypothetical protein